MVLTALGWKKTKCEVPIASLLFGTVANLREGVVISSSLQKAIKLSAIRYFIMKLHFGEVMPRGRSEGFNTTKIKKKKNMCNE